MKLKIPFLKSFHWLRILIIVIIPIILSIWLFVYPLSFEFDRINQTKEISNSPQNIQILKYPKVHSPTEEARQFTSNFLSSIFHVPLELNLIYYCFKDKGTFLEYFTTKGSENDYKNFNWTLNFNNEKNFTILRNGIKCEQVNKNKEFTYNWELNFIIILKGGYTKGLIFHPNTTSFAKKDRIEVIAKSITLILAWMTICWMLDGVWKIIKK